MRRWLLLLASVLAGCTSTDLRLEPPPDGTQTTLVAIATNDGVRVWGGRWEAVTLEAELSGGDLVFVGYYEASPAAFGIDDAEDFVELTIVQEGLSLDGFLVAWSQTYGTHDAWQTQTSVPGPLLGVRLAGGCFRGRTEPLGVLGVPCDDVPPVNPRAGVANPPEPPQDPAPDCTNGATVHPRLAVNVCEPFDPPNPRCGVAERLALPDGDCVSVGPETCDRWPNVANDAIFVEPMAVGGDGSRTTPYGSIAEALAVAVDGDTIALSAGAFAVSPTTIDVAVSIVGACASATSIDVPGPLTVRATVTIRDVTLTAVELRAEGVLDVERAHLIVPAVHVTSTFTAREARLDGLVDARAGEVRLEDVTVADSKGNGVGLAGGSTGTLTRVAIRRCRGFAAVFAVESTATLRETLVDEAAIRGVATQAGRLDVDGLALRDIGDPADMNAPSAFALNAFQDAHIDARNVSIRRPTHAAVVVQGTSTATIADLVIEDLRAADDAGFYFAVAATNTATVVLDGLYVSGTGAVLALTDGHIVARDAVLDGRGDGVLPSIRTHDGSTARLERVVVNGSPTLGVNTSGDSTTDLLDVTVVGTVDSSTTTVAAAVAATDSATIAGARIVVDGVPGRGLYAGANARIRFDDTTLRDVRWWEVDVHGGDAVFVESGARVTLDRARIHEYDRRGFVGFGGTADLRHVRIEYADEQTGVILYEDPEGPLRPLSLLRNVELWRATGGTPGTNSHAVRVENMPVRMRDILLRNVVSTGIELSGVRAEPVLENIEIVDVRGRGIEILSDAHTIADGIRITGTTATNANEGAIYLDEGSIELSNFVLDDNDVGLRSRPRFGTRPSLIADGTFSNNGVALEVSSFDAPLLELVDVFFVGNAKDIAPR